MSFAQHPSRARVSTKDSADVVWKLLNNSVRIAGHWNRAPDAQRSIGTLPTHLSSIHRRCGVKRAVDQVAILDHLASGAQAKQSTRLEHRA
jgi:hypothetical protein